MSISNTRGSAHKTAFSIERLFEKTSFSTVFEGRLCVPLFLPVWQDAIAFGQGQQQDAGERGTASQITEQQKDGEKYLAVAGKVADSSQTGSRKVRVGQQRCGVRTEQQERAQGEQGKQCAARCQTA